MLREVPTRGRAMPWHSVAGWRLEARGWRPPAVVGGWIAPPGSRAGPRAAPVGSAPLLEDTDVGGLTLRQRRIIKGFALLFYKHYFYKRRERSKLIGAQTHLMWAELGPVQLAQRVLHVLSAQELHHALAVALHVGEADVACLAHVILQVLPTASWRQAWKRGERTVWNWPATSEISSHTFMLRAQETNPTFTFVRTRSVWPVW